MSKPASTDAGRINDPNGLSFPHLVAAVITAVVGGGVFSMVGDFAAAGASTGAVLIGWVVSGIGVFCLMMCFFGLSRFKPELTGGIFSYARAGFGEFTGFLSAYGYWISAVLSMVSYTALMFASIAYFFPVFGEGNNVASAIGASIILWICCTLVCRGVKEAASVNIVTTIAKLVPLFVAIVAIIFASAFDPAIFMANFWDESNGVSTWDQVVGMVNVTIWIFLGIEGAVAISGRAKYSKDVGRSTVTAFIGILLIYLLISLLSMGVLTREELAALGNPSLAGVLEAAVGPWGAALVSLGVGLSLLGSMLGYTIISSEVPHEAAMRGVFPESFMKRSKHGGPIVTCITSCVIIQIFVILNVFVEQAYQFFYGLAVCMILVPYFFSTLYMVVCVVKKDGMQDVSNSTMWFYRVIAIVGFLYSIFLIYAGGLVGLMVTTVLFAPGILLFAYGQKQRGKPVLPHVYDKILAVVIIGFCVISIILMITGQVSVF